MTERESVWQKFVRDLEAKAQDEVIYFSTCWCMIRISRHIGVSFLYLDILVHHSYLSTCCCITVVCRNIDVSFVYLNILVYIHYIVHLN